MLAASTMFLLMVLLVFLFFHVYTRYSKYGRFVNKIQGPQAYPLVGNLLSLNETCPHELWVKVRKLSSDYYPIFKVWFVKNPVVSISNPEDAEILLTSAKAIEKGYVYNHLHPWLKTGLLTSTGEKWRQRRKILTPAFHFNILKKYLNVMIEETDRYMENLKSEGDEMIKSLLPLTSNFTLNVMCETAMNVTLENMNRKTIDEYKKAIQDFGYAVVYRIPRPYIFDWMMKPFWTIGQLQRDSLKILHDFTNKVVSERRAYHEKTQYKYLTDVEDSKDSCSDTKSKKKLSMLDLLLAAERKGLINDKGIKEEVDTFTFEGHDTTGMALTYTLMLLAENKEAQGRARAEVTEILDRTGKDIDMSTLNEFEYLNACIKESLRLYPPVSTIFRKVEEDLQLKNAFIPGGTHVMINFYDIHRDPNYWSEPTLFNPDRFLTENSNNRHPFCYVPFSAGFRNCIGQRFAMMELKLSIARILHEFYLEPIDRTEDLKLTADLVIRPLNPVSIKFIKIKK